MAAVGGVHSVHDLHIWTLSSNRTALSAHLVIDDLVNWESILHDVGLLLAERYGIEHITLQPETSRRTIVRVPAPTASRAKTP